MKTLVFKCDQLLSVIIGFTFCLFVYYSVLHCIVLYCIVLYCIVFEHL